MTGVGDFGPRHGPKPARRLRKGAGQGFIPTDVQLDNRPIRRPFHSLLEGSDVIALEFSIMLFF